jgi:hypothetical protein
MRTFLIVLVSFISYGGGSVTTTVLWHHVFHADCRQNQHICDDIETCLGRAFGMSLLWPVSLWLLTAAFILNRPSRSERRKQAADMLAEQNVQKLERMAREALLLYQIENRMGIHTREEHPD